MGDWMSWDTSGDREGWLSDQDSDDGCSAQRKVPELLAEQVEAADVLVVNRVDLAGKDQVKVAASLARSLNEKADLFETEFGNVSVREVLGGFTPSSSSSSSSDSA